MNACVGCERNCCVDQGSKAGIDLGAIDCIKLIAESQNDASFSVKKHFFSSTIYHDGERFAEIKYFIGLSGNLVYPCPLLSDDLSCVFYNNEASNPDLREWLVNKGISTNLRPLTCRTFPYFIDAGWFFEGFHGWFELSNKDIKRLYNTGCNLAIQSLSDYEKSMLKKEIILGIGIGRGFVRELLKGNLTSILK